MEELLSQSATSMARAVRKGEVSSVELVRAHLDQIDKVNPALNAVVTRCDEAALAAAASADQMIVDRARLGLFHGVPMTIKDALDTAGVVTTGGTTGRRTFVPASSATAVQRLHDAGAVLIGKTNTPDLTLSYDTENKIFGQTYNPYDPTLSPGGSSGGAAAIIAAGGAAFDLGSDTGGSIRFPAHCCGIAGIRPTRGRVPRTGLVIPAGSPVDSATVVGPMARTVEDLAVLLGVIGGPDGIDTSLVPMPLGDAFNTPLRRRRVAVHVDDGACAAAPDVASATRQAAEVLADAGAIVEDATPPGLGVVHDLYGRVFGADGMAWIHRILEAFGSTEHGFGPPPTEPTIASDYLEAVQEVTEYCSAMLSWFQDYDLIVCPPHAYAALPVGESMGAALRGAGYLQTHNLTGWPSAVVRAGSTAAGLPVGVQLVAHPWQDHVALAAALEIERALGGWSPPDMAQIGA